MVRRADYVDRKIRMQSLEWEKFDRLRKRKNVRSDAQFIRWMMYRLETEICRGYPVKNDGE